MASSDKYYLDKGYVVIINQYKFDGNPKSTRIGALKDVVNLEQTFKELKFDVKTLQDKTYDKIMAKINKIARNVKLKDYDCLIIIVMTHGGPNGGLLSKDSLTYPIDELWQPFVGEACPFNEKPKLFFIQACRGANLNTAIRRRRSVGDARRDVIDERPLQSLSHDFLFMFSTAEGFPSWRGNDGSWFIKELCKILNSKDLMYEEDLLSLLTRVNYQIANYYLEEMGTQNEEEEGTVIRCVQSSNIYTTLTQPLYFPKIVNDTIPESSQGCLPSSLRSLWKN